MTTSNINESVIKNKKSEIESDCTKLSIYSKHGHNIRMISDKIPKHTLDIVN